MHHTSYPFKVTHNEALAYLIPTMYQLEVQHEYVATEVRDAQFRLFWLQYNINEFLR